LRTSQHEPPFVSRLNHQSQACIIGHFDYTTKKARPFGTRLSQFSKGRTRNDQALPVAESTLIVTPGPIVEVKETFFMYVPFAPEGFAF